MQESTYWLKVRSSFFNEIPWILVIDSWIEGPKVGIIAITHWNEPAWLQAFDYIVDKFYNKNLLKNGSLYLIAANIKAFENYLKTKNKSDTRFVDINMNRVWKHLNQWDAYEVQRYLQLEPILQSLDVALDIHSTSTTQNSLMCITDPQSSTIAKHIFDTPIILVDSDPLSLWVLISPILKNNKPAFGIECGTHTDTQAYKTAIQNINNLLSYYKLIDSPIKKTTERLWTFFFHTEVFPLTSHFSYSKNYQNFDPISPWATYAQDWNNLYINSSEKTLYIGLIWLIPTPGDGICFLFEKE